MLVRAIAIPFSSIVFLTCLPRYNLNRRVHCVKAYPVLSPQGANIVIYGHENGIAVMWRGGRRLKDAKKPDKKPPAKSSSVMILDSDDDDNGDAAATSSATAFVDKPVFEDTSAATDAGEGGFPEVVQTLDLALNQAVLSIAVLPLAPCAAQDAEPSLLQTHMVFAITCRATADVFVATLPLTPPSHESKTRPQLRASNSLLSGSLGRGAFGDVLIPLGGQSRRCEGVAMALARNSITGASSTSGARSSSSHSLTRVVVAAHGREASGTLRLWDVPVGARRTSASDRPIEPFQTEYLPNPLTCVAFNPTQPTQLLAVDPQRAVRLYDYTIPAIPADDMSEGPFPLQGSWLLSLYPPFARGSPTTAARKPIVAAAWIARGHAILALLADGQWGVWDIDRNSSASSGSGAFGVGSTTTGVRGAALTAFSISGQLEGTTPLRNSVAAPRRSLEGEFMPMTPHTRRDVLATVFGAGVERLVSTVGGVEVIAQRTLRGSAAGKESVVLWLGGADYTVAVIPDVSRFWDSQLRRASGGVGGDGAMFSGARPTRIMRVQDLQASLKGERCCGAAAVAWIPAPTRTGSDDADDEGDDRDQQLEIIIQGESRLVAVRETDLDILSGGLSTRVSTAASLPRKRKVGDTVTSAILVEPRLRKPGGVKFDLDTFQQRQQQSSLRQAPTAAASGLAAGGGTPRRPPLTASLFESPSRPGPSTAAMTPQRPGHRSLFENEVTLTQSMMRPQQPQQQPSASLAFAGDLEEAANASDDEEAARDRNVEEEMLDIMEIDRELEAMQRRDGSRHVFFEGA